MDAELLQLAGVGVGINQHPAAVAGRLADPAREKAGVPGIEGALELLDQPAVLGQRLAERGRVLEEDVDPDPRVRSGDAGHVAQRPACGGERLVAVDPTRAGLVHEQVRERVREVAGERD